MNKSTFLGKYRALIFAVGLAVALLLAGCGKKAPPVPPPSALANMLAACQARKMACGAKELAAVSKPIACWFDNFDTF